MSKEDLARIHEELVVDHVHVHPDMRGLVSEEAEAHLEELVAQQDVATYVVVWPYRDSDAYGGKPADLLTRLQQQFPQKGVFLSNTTALGQNDYANIRLEGRQWGIPGERDGDLEDYQVLSTVSFEKHTELAPALDRALELLLLSPEEVDAAHEEAMEAARVARGDDPAHDDGGGDDGSGVVGDVLTALVAMVAAVAVWRIVKSFRSARQPTPLPKSAMTRIRQAKDRELDARARRDLLALGELLDEHEISATDHRGAWQAALDHYAEARRILGDDQPDVLDVVGAIVLVDRGQAALAAAHAGKPYVPEPTCFLNPLHGLASKGRKVELDGRLVDVPVCNACRSALKHHAVPDILDVVRRGRPQHYFDTDAEPWASTGYGALRPDLVTALQTRR